ncbi:EndoU domain-containing protein [Clostridium butyricum]|uniref:EndoU domain-containing protein n=1 Tax=Clostridium butyricum TaxID=1492 RepID=UPI003F8FB2A6
MEKKILEGQRKSPTKNEVIGGHSSDINNNNSNFAVEEISINPDGTKNISFTKDLQDGNISKLKKSTVFPESWNDSKIIDSIREVGDSPTILVRQRDGATWHRQIVDGVEIDVIKIGDDVISGYPTGKVNAPKPSGF